MDHLLNTVKISKKNDLKAGIMPESAGFGEDSPMYYGVAKYRNANGDWIENKLKHRLVITVVSMMQRMTQL